MAAPVAATSVDPVTNKRILPAFILAFLLGAFGAHAFYAGQIFQGVIYLLMWIGFVVLGSVGSPFQGIPLLCVAVFALSDIIRIVVGVYKDGKGSKITQWT
jgi:TM2 domain-containing membrane protein YozV